MSPFNREQCIALLKACGSWCEGRDDGTKWTDDELKVMVANRRTSGLISEELRNRVLNDLHEQQVTE